MTRNPKTLNILLWIAQAVLALLFLFAGGMKLVMPLDAMEQGPIELPGAFLRFIGTAECLGALGLVLPGLFGIHRYLTPVAAAGLGIIMIGATTLTAAGLGWLASLFPLVVGLVCAGVFVGRGGAEAGLARRASGHVPVVTR